MRILVNASNIHVGGGTQVALSFINLLKDFRHYQFCIFASSKVYEQINFELLPKDIEVHEINFGLKEWLLGKSKAMLIAEEKFSPDVVFTIFGPSYWTPKSKHLTGFAMPWLINPETKAFGELSLKMLFIKKTQNLVKGYFVKKNSNYFVVETEDVKNRLNKFFKIPLSNTWVVDNTYNQHFKGVSISKTNTEEYLRLITITANYPHKNLRIIKKVLPILIERNLKVCFTLSIPADDFKNTFGEESAYLKNLGPVSSKDCPKHYNDSDALFLPTLLECFTASYPEAMIMERPILTSDLPFARQICGEGNALFFDPLNAVDIADKIEKLVKDEKLYDDLVQRGLSRVKDFCSSEERANSYISILEEIHGN
jgi:glycosyltransferase involved in cell wall biosynthesis